MDGSNFIITARPQAETAVESVTVAQPEPAAADMPKAVGYALIGAFGFSMLSFMAFFGGTTQSLFMTVISLAYLTAYLAVPVVFFRIHPKSAKPVSWAQFLAKGMDTWTGHLSGKEAFVQIMTIPVALMIAAIAMGVALHIAR